MNDVITPFPLDDELSKKLKKADKVVEYIQLLKKKLAQAQKQVIMEKKINRKLQARIGELEELYIRRTFRGLKKSSSNLHKHWRQINIMNEINHETPLDTLLNVVDEKINDLRNKLRDQADKVIDEMPPMGKPISGNIFVESIGSILEFDQNGNFEYTYTPDSLTLRAPGLFNSDEDRERVFNDIAQQFPENSRILNIGAGGDSIPPVCMDNFGHEVICTDFAQNTIEVLAQGINTPVFACDLVYLNDILPDNSIDFIIGNSTLGYVDPKKLRLVLGKIASVMRLGGVFTFDLAPNHVYYRMQDPKKRQTVANESEVDPTKLIAFVNKYGKFNAINAMAIYSYYRTYYTNVAVILLIKEIFEELGLSCRTSYQQITQDGGGRMTQFILRVSKDYPDILNLVENENELSEITDVNISEDDTKLGYRLTLIDRQNGEILARKFGIHTTKEADPWSVVHYINDHLWTNPLPPEIREEVLHEIDPQILYEKMRPIIYGEDIPEQIPLPLEIIADQVTHKIVITGANPMSPEEADIKISQIYEDSERKKRLKRQSDKEKKLKQSKKKKRKQTRKHRKKK